MSEIDSPQTNENEKSTLDKELELIARDIVESLGYSGAMVAAYERGDALPARAVYTHPSIASVDKIKEWEKQIQNISPPKYRISITDPAIARVYLHHKKYKDNLSVKAAEKRGYIISEDLFDLFTPIVPKIAKPFVKIIQGALKIKQVIAVPFFIDGEYVGNLFAASKNDFSVTDIQILNAFAHRAASSIRSERRRLQGESNQKLILDMQRDISSEEKILDRIVVGVVNDLGYTGAMVATYERGDALPARATYLDPSIATMDQIRKWEKQIQIVSPRGYRISITDPEIARVYLRQDKYKNNLSVKAAESGDPVVSNDLFDLFTPIVPDIAHPVVKIIQGQLNIRQVIAVPFFIENDYVGNLFAITKSEKFSDWEIDLLKVFGQNAAAGLRNARTYRRSEDRRKAAEIFGRMAFSASASVHAFRNHVGLIRGNMGLLDQLDILATDDARRREILGQILPPMKDRLNKITDILDSLHTPWQVQQDSDVDVNTCISHALRKVISNWEEEKWISFESQSLPVVKTSQEMLTEMFKILIKNANEAIVEKKSAASSSGWQGLLSIETRLLSNTLIEVKVHDNGIGIKLEHFEKMFEMRWSTKSSGLGFGLFWAKDYVEGLGGEITFDSNPIDGTTFTVLLPPLINQKNAS